MRIVIIILHFTYKLIFYSFQIIFSAVTSQPWTFSVRKKTRKRVLIQESPWHTKKWPI